MVVPGVIPVFLGFWRTYGPQGSLRIGTALGWKTKERLRFVVTCQVISYIVSYRPNIDRTG